MTSACWPETNGPPTQLEWRLENGAIKRPISRLIRAREDSWYRELIDTRNSEIGLAHNRATALLWPGRARTRVPPVYHEKGVYYDAFANYSRCDLVEQHDPQGCRGMFLDHPINAYTRD